MRAILTMDGRRKVEMTKTDLKKLRDARERLVFLAVNLRDTKLASECGLAGALIPKLEAYFQEQEEVEAREVEEEERIRISETTTA